MIQIKKEGNNVTVEIVDVDGYTLIDALGMLEFAKAVFLQSDSVKEGETSNEDLQELQE